MTSQNSVNLSKSGLEQVTNARRGKKPPPLHLWNPPFCGDIDIRIARDGSWYHEGGKINRPEMVALFASILRREEDAYFLVTPVEKVGITVEDVPFVAVELEQQQSGADQRLSFTTQIGDIVPLDAEHPIRIEINDHTGEPAPYVMVRAGLEARLDRKTFYRLVDLAFEKEINGTQMFGVMSSGQFFALSPVADLS